MALLVTVQRARQPEHHFSGGNPTSLLFVRALVRLRLALGSTGVCLFLLYRISLWTETRRSCQLAESGLPFRKVKLSTLGRARLGA